MIEMASDDFHIPAGGQIAERGLQRAQFLVAAGELQYQARGVRRTERRAESAQRAVRILARQAGAAVGHGEDGERLIEPPPPCRAGRDIVRHDMDRLLGQSDEARPRKGARCPDFGDVAVAARPVRRRIRQLPGPVGDPIGGGRVRQNAADQMRGLRRASMEHICRTGPMGHPEQRVAQRRRDVQQFGIDAQLAQCIPLQAGTAGDAVVASERGDNDHPAEITLTRAAAQKAMCQRFRASQVAIGQRPSQTAARCCHLLSSSRCKMK